MNVTGNPIAHFRVRRLIGLWIGAAVPGLLLLFAVLAFRTSLLPAWVGIGSLAVAFVAGFYASLKYRCPVCNKCPESDLPTFYPESCCHCGTRLR